MLSRVPKTLTVAALAVSRNYLMLTTSAHPESRNIQARITQHLEGNPPIPLLLVLSLRHGAMTQVHYLTAPSPLGHPVYPAGDPDTTRELQAFAAQPGVEHWHAWAAETGVTPEVADIALILQYIADRCRPGHPDPAVTSRYLPLLAQRLQGHPVLVAEVAVTAAERFPYNMGPFADAATAAIQDSALQFAVTTMIALDPAAR